MDLFLSTRCQVLPAPVLANAPYGAPYSWFTLLEVNTAIIFAVLNLRFWNVWKLKVAVWNSNWSIDFFFLHNRLCAILFREVTAELQLLIPIVARQGHNNRRYLHKQMIYVWHNGEWKPCQGGRGQEMSGWWGDKMHAACWCGRRS